MSESPRGRPSGWWFVGPVLLVVGSVALYVVLVVSTVRDRPEVVARVPVDAEPHAVTVGTGSGRMLMGVGYGADCTIRDRAGDDVPLGPIFGHITIDRDGQQFKAHNSFDPGDGEIVITCTRPEYQGERQKQVLIAERADAASTTKRVIDALVVPMMIGGVGLLWGIILLALMVSRRAPTGAPSLAPPPPSPQPPPPPPAGQ